MPELGPPHAWPAWLTPARVASGLVGSMAATTTALLAIALPGGAIVRTLVVVASVFVAFQLGRFACSARDAATALGRSAVAGGLLAVISVGVVFPFAVCLAGVDVDASIGGLFLMSLAGATIFGGPIGAGVGIAYAVIPVIAAQIRERPSHGGVDRLITAGGMWMIVLGGVHALVLSALMERRLDAGAITQIVAAFLWLFPLVLGTFLLTVASGRYSDRQRFLSNARQGKDARFRVAPRASAVVPDGVLPLVHAPAASCGSVLIRVGSPARETLYRDAPEAPAEDRVIALL